MLAVLLILVVTSGMTPISAKRRGRQDPNTVYWTDSNEDADDDDDDPNSPPSSPGDRTPSGEAPLTYLVPSPENVASRASISANATCGQVGVGAEQWCKVRGGCAMCDATSPDPHKRHPARHAIDGDPNTWWQSPMVPSGQDVTVAVVLDLNHAYDVQHVVVTSGPSPPPAAWRLERSLDGQTWRAWHLFATSDADCHIRYGVTATPGDPRQLLPRESEQSDEDEPKPTCSSFYSRMDSSEFRVIHMKISGSQNLARFVRLVMEVPGGVSDDARRRFYSVKDIRVIARCACNGHARSCKFHGHKGAPAPKCNCEHGTTGAACERCRPLWQQQPWRPGRPCKRCRCHGHARSCRYDPVVGGGICEECADHTTGVHCEHCQSGWFRPKDVAPDAVEPCRRCDCDASGGTGECDAEGCRCWKGFAGERCDRCEPGYVGYPLCKPCPCDSRGTARENTCEGGCVCKSNVEGVECNRCKPGYFGLSDRNPKGCLECFCSGKTDRCVPAVVSNETIRIEDHDGWLVVAERLTVKGGDITESAEPSRDADTGDISIGHEEVSASATELYYWLAPPAYSGNRLELYGGILEVDVSWEVMRGDSSGRPTAGVDVILEGGGVRLGYGGGILGKDINRLMIAAPLSPSDSAVRWVLLDVPGQPAASRQDFMTLLADVKRIYVRGKFNTDQIGASLRTLALVATSEGGVVEQCDCPPGYRGLSCESCAFGYVRNSEGHCQRCSCNGHAESCDPITGQCTECLHNTTGPDCGICQDGFYGVATKGTRDDCRVCACPLFETDSLQRSKCRLVDPGNNVVLAETNYICTCPDGHEGYHCERCAVGYFGAPLAGRPCQICNCGATNGEPSRCDPETGRCIECPRNTDGWHCNKCKEEHFGDPALGCGPCECALDVGAVSSSCDPVTGQCVCRPFYTGRVCDQCDNGRGNVTAGCPQCLCDDRGSFSSVCDNRTGECPCRPGAAGPTCASCLPLHYGFGQVDDSIDLDLLDELDEQQVACRGCHCHPYGARHTTCDIVSGQCDCRPNVVGRNCGACKDGFWNLESGEGCRPCSCDPLGSVGPNCDTRTGQCTCRPGVGGLTCDLCLPGYFGLSKEGCKACEPCNLPGHICDPDTGRCVCPALTSGASCDSCVPNSWGFRTGRGCKPCGCEIAGSIQAQCDPMSGECSCRPGFTGNRCERCAFGYYGFPRCSPCKCNLGGTRADQCNATTGQCACNSKGQCPCKANVHGQKCFQCREGTFSLRPDDPDGCQTCFCFGRTTKCTEEGLIWGRVSQLRPRTLRVEYDDEAPTHFAPGSQLLPINTQEICYINLAVPGLADVNLNASDNRLNVTNNLRIIPGSDGDVKLGVTYLFDTPVYWQLPRQFLGDKVLSYGGYLRFLVETEGGTTLFPPDVLSSYPLIQLQGNNRLVLEHYPTVPNPAGKYEVRLHQSLWRIKNNITGSVSRETLMLALQNVQHILIRATDSIDFKTAVLRGISLDHAEERPGAPAIAARGVEKCECPSKYSSPSCQDPNIGFFRWRLSGSSNMTGTVTSTIIIQTIGEARPCQCNGRSRFCDPETGHCLNCIDHTGGAECERCADGYYGDPALGPCLPCPCPGNGRNFARGCQVPLPPAQLKCYCREGYTDKLCDRCAYGWYGYPKEPGGYCRPCMCDPDGSVSDECHEETGQCNCKPGITGRDCSTCEARHVLTPRGCTGCDDSCTGVLLDDFEAMTADLNEKAGQLESTEIAPPWGVLDEVRVRVDELGAQLTQRRQMLERAASFNLHPEEVLLKSTRREAKRIEETSIDTKTKSLELVGLANELQEELYATRKHIDGLVAKLQSRSSPDGKNYSVENAIKEAEWRLKSIESALPLLEPRARSVHDSYTYCDGVLDGLQRLIDFSATGKVDAFKSRYDRLNFALDHLGVTLNDTNEDINQVKRFHNDRNRKRIEHLRNLVAKLLALDANLTVQRINTTKQLEEASRTIKIAHKDMEELEKLKEVFQNLTVVLKKHILPVRSDHVNSVKNHAKMLQHRAKTYQGLFATANATTALQASKAYIAIVEALDTARQSAINATTAATEAYKKVYPGFGLDTLQEKADNAKIDSEQLQNQAIAVHERVKKLQSQLSESDEAVARLRNSIKAAGRGNNEVDRLLQELDQYEVSQEAQRVLEQNEIVAREISAAKQLTADIMFNITNHLRPKMQKAQNDLEFSLSRADSHISEGRAKAQQANDILLTITETSITQQLQFKTVNDSLSEKFDELRNLIARAHHTAQGIRLALKSDPGVPGGCIRSFKLPTAEASTTTSIHFEYAIDNNVRSSPLVFLGGSQTDDFVAIEMVDRKIHFAWNLGGGPGEVTHPLRIQTTNEFNANKLWYRIEAERTSNVGRLTVVQSSTPDVTSNVQSVSNASSASFSRLDIQTGEQVWIGTYPPAFLVVSSTARSVLRAPTDSGIAGCMHSVRIDGQSLGLWNFHTTSAGCTSCVKRLVEGANEQAFRFAGDGYSVLRHYSNSPYNKYLFSVSFNFRTLDENALLFLGATSHPDRYVSLALVDGRVRFRVGYGEESFLEMSTRKRYNTGKWARLEATRYFDRSRKQEKGLLKVDSETRDGAPSDPPTADSIPDMSNASYLVGGVPPGYKPVGPHIKPLSFLGCLSEVQIAQEGYNLIRGQYYGIEPTCSDKKLYTASYSGKGYLELASHALRKKASFSFVFATSQPDGILMLSTFEKPDLRNDTLIQPPKSSDDTKESPGYYSVTVFNGHLEVRVDAGKGTVKLSSKISVSDGLFYALSITKNGRRLELRVNDDLQSTGTLPEGATVVKAPGESGGLFFGGVPPGLNASSMTATNAPFVGSIKDVIFNNELVAFNSEQVNFRHVGIGRMGPVHSTWSSTPLSNPPAQSSMQSHPGFGDSTEVEEISPGKTGCRKIPSYSVEPGAVKLGDSPHSHIQANFRRRNIFQKDFELDVEFRTYYPDGLLLVVPGAKGKQRQYIVVFMLDGILQAMVRGRKKLDMIMLNKYNDGDWHRVKLSKDGRNLYLVVDSDPPEHKKAPKRFNVSNTLYIGGLPENFQQKMPDNFILRMKSFRGCMRNLSINRQPQDFVGEEAVHNNVGLCFREVEAGSYFAGDAYAIFIIGSGKFGNTAADMMDGQHVDALCICSTGNKFHAGALLEIDLDFRTSHTTGVLLSLSDTNGFAAFSLELNNGKVILAGDIGDGKKFILEQSFASRWTLCDNKWHRIEVHYRDSTLILQVDTSQQNQTLFDNSQYLEMRLAAPLFVGGLAEHAVSRTLGTRENFKGCIKNLMVGGDRRDWADMASLHHVLLGSCPDVREHDDTNSET